MPDVIVPMPDVHSIAIGKALAVLLDRPFVRALGVGCEYREQCLEEEGELLIFDVSNSIAQLKKGALALSESFPKRIYILSLLPFS